MPSPINQSARFAGLAVRVLLDERAEHVAHVLVQRPALALVVERGLVLRDAVRELVADDVERLREAVEDLAVPVRRTPSGARSRTRC
jgi:hypothetical protein